MDALEHFQETTSLTLQRNIRESLLEVAVFDHLSISKLASRWDQPEYG